MSKGGRRFIHEGIAADIKARLEWGEPVDSIARALGVALATIEAIRNGVIWRHVPTQLPLFRRTDGK